MDCLREIVHSFVLDIFFSLNLYFAQKLLRKAKNCSRSLEPQKVVPKLQTIQNGNQAF